jgi:hypothetical protein
MNWRFYVYNTAPYFRASRLWTLLQTQTRLPLLYPKDPRTRAAPESEAYAFKTRLFLDVNGGVQRIRAVCYSFRANEERANNFFTAIAMTAVHGVRFVIRDPMTNAWFKSSLAKEPEEVANRVRALMGPSALPAGYKWAKSKPTQVAGPGSNLDTE